MTSLLFIDPAARLPGTAGAPGSRALYMLVADGEVKADAVSGAVGWWERSALELDDAQAWWVPLGRVDGCERYAAVRIGLAGASEAKAFRPARQAGYLNLFQLARCPRSEQQAAARAVHLAGWLHRSRYCGSCGQESAYIGELNKRVCSNPACRAEIFPRIEPAVLVLVVCGERCLLARQSGFPPGYMAPLAGFIEAGETPEQAVAREVAEETGLVVLSSQYRAAQPWPFPGALMLGYIAEVAHGEKVCLSGELEAASWHARDALVAAMRQRDRQGALILPPPGVLGRALIAAWAEGSGPA